MQSYRHLLLAVDFSESCMAVVERATDLVKRYQSEISLVHVVDNLPISEPGYDVLNSLDLDLTEVMVNKANEKLSALASKLSVPEEGTHLRMGRPVSEITALAEEQQIDLIVIGSHGRHGFGLLLGSTVNGVLHHAKCDVLAVRVFNAG